MGKISKLLALVIEPERYGAFLISHRNNPPNYPLFELEQYGTFANTNAFHDHLIFNPTHIKSQITAFLKNEKTDESLAVAIALDGTTIHESVQTQKNSTLNAHQNANWLRHEMVINNNSQEPLSYIAGMQKHHILQYHLLAKQLGRDLARLATINSSLLFLYRYVYGSVFKPALLQEHLLQKNNRIENLLSDEIVSRLVTIAPHITIDTIAHKKPLLTACALMASERH